jgi:predicted nucleotidyltransferase
LTEIEVSKNIEIVYAVEFGPIEWSLETKDAKRQVRFMFIRNDRGKYVRENSYESISDSNDNFRWTGDDITGEIDSINRPRARLAETLFANKVYRRNEKYGPIIDKMKQFMLEEPHVSNLIDSYDSSARSSFTVLIDKDDVFLDKYLKLIRDVATIQWLDLKFVRQIDEHNRPTKLVETDFSSLILELVNEFHDENPDDEANPLYRDISTLINRVKRSEAFDRVKRSEIIDNWIIRVLKNSHDVFLKAEAKEENMPREKADEVKKSLLNEVKFNKFDRFRIPKI